MPTLGRLALAALAATAFAVAMVPIAGADDGRQPLTGEEFLVQDVTLALDCDPARVSTVTFSASGIAIGPFPGPFTVQGTVTIAAQTFAGPRPGTVAGPLLSLHETFTIDSPLGTVTGVKRLPHGLPFDSSFGSCQQVTDFAVDDVVAAEGTVVDIFSTPRYGAHVTLPTRHAHDRGDALFSMTELDLDGTCTEGPCHFRQAAFSQGFTSSQPSRDDNGNDMDDPFDGLLGG